LKNDNKEAENHLSRREEQSLIKDFEDDEKCIIEEEGILMEDDADGIFAIYFSGKETDSFIQQSIEKGKVKEEI